MLSSINAGVDCLIRVFFWRANFGSEPLHHRKTKSIGNFSDAIYLYNTVDYTVIYEAFMKIFLHHINVYGKKWA